MGGRWVSTASGREHPPALELLFPQTRPLPQQCSAMLVVSRKHTNFELDVHAPWILSMPPPDSYAGGDGSAPLAINNLVGAFTEVTTLTRSPLLRQGSNHSSLVPVASFILGPLEMNSPA